MFVSGEEGAGWGATGVEDCCLELRSRRKREVDFILPSAAGWPGVLPDSLFAVVV